MRWKDWLDHWGMKGLKLNLQFLELEWSPTDKDKDAAWELYIELLTRIATQPLSREDGDEAAALSSIHTLFGLTREILRRNGRGCHEFTKIAIVVLNQVIRPFTAKWHRLELAGAFAQPENRATFRDELTALQTNLERYTRMLADMAGVEDLTRLETTPDSPRPV